MPQSPTKLTSKYLAVTLFFLLSVLSSHVNAQNIWTKKADFFRGGYMEGAAFSIDGKGYFVLGAQNNELWQYDPATNIWTKKKNCPAGTYPWAGQVYDKGRQAGVSFVIGSKAYVGTGEYTDDTGRYFSNTFWEYDPLIDAWTKKASYPGQGRVYGIGFAIGNKGYVGTGFNDPSSWLCTKDFYEYDPIANKWTRKADFAGGARAFAFAFSANGLGYVGGGLPNLNVYEALSDCWAYDPKVNQWIKKADSPPNMVGSVSFNIGDKGYIGGGFGVNRTSEFFEYNAVTNTWKDIAGLTGPDIYGGSVTYVSGFSIGGKAYVGNGNMAKSFYEYSPCLPNIFTPQFDAAQDTLNLASMKVIFSTQKIADRTYAWQFGDGTTLYSDLSGGTPDKLTQEHYYGAPGAYNVRLISSNSCYSDTVIKTIVVKTEQKAILSFPTLPSSTYGSADFSPSVSSNNTVTPITLSSSNTAVATIVNNKIHVVGAGYTAIIASQAAGNGYSAANEVVQSLTVNPAPLTVTATNRTRVYGAANPEFKVTYTGFVNGDNASALGLTPTVSATATTSSPVGTYPITINSVAPSNYTLSYVPGELRITKADLTITADNKNKKVGEAVPSLTATFSGFVNGDTPAGLLTPVQLTTAATPTSAEGVYPIIASGATSGNYKITYVQGVLTVSAPITPPPVISYASSSRTFTAGKAISPLTPINTGGPPAGYTISPALPAGLTIDVSTGTINGTPAASSPTTVYTITAHNSGGSSVATVSIRILSAPPQQAVISFPAISPQTYGSADFAPEASSNNTVTPIIYSSNNTAVAVIVTGKIRIVGTGTTIITAKQAAGNNYLAANDAAQSLTVNKAALTISTADKTRVYGSANPVFKVTYSGFVNNEDNTKLGLNPSVSTPATPSSAMGSYPINIGAVTLTNYDVTYVSAILRIIKADLTIIADNKSKNVGDPMPVFTASYTGFVNGETPASLLTPVSFSTSATAGSAAGTYAVIAKGATSNNYKITFQPGVLTVTNTSAFGLMQVNNATTDEFKSTSSPAPVVSQALSPNGDGINDVLKIENINLYRDNSLTILNAAGTAVFKVSGYDNQTKFFDGHSNITGKQLPVGTYFYVLEYRRNNTAERITGYFIIK